MSELYTLEIQKKIHGLAIRACLSTGGAVDADELFSVAECAIAKHMHRFDPEKAPCFAAWCWPRAKWAMQDYMRKIDMVPRRQRKAGVKGTAVVQIDSMEGWQADELLGGTAPDHKFVDEENKAVLMKCLHALPERDEEVIRMYFFEGQEYGEYCGGFPGHSVEDSPNTQIVRSPETSGGF